MFDGLIVNAEGLMAGSNWSVTAFLNGLNNSLRLWGTFIVAIIGVVMVIVAVFNIGKGLMSGGRSQTNWVMNIILFFLGGALAFGTGWSLVADIAKGGEQTLTDLGTAGSIIISPFQQLF